MLHPWSALAALAAPPRPTLEQHWLGAVGPRGATTALARVADLIGVQWRGPSAPGLQLRYRTLDGGWSGWVSASAHGHGPDAVAPDAAQVGDPVWSGGATAVQLRCPRTLSGVRLHLVDVSAGRGASRLAQAHGALASSTLPLAAPVLAAGPGQPAIVARRAWAQAISRPRVVPEYGDVRMAFVHHTDNPNGYSAGEVPAMLRAIYVFHRYVNGWNDIGYNFAIDLYGRIFEARAGGIDESVVGAHAGGFNRYSTGVAVLGSFMSSAVSARALASLEHLLAWKLSLHGAPTQGRVSVTVNPAGAHYSRFPANARVSLPRIAGHRDADSTDCPGDVLYGQLAGVRAGATALAGAPVRITLALATVGEPGPAATTPATTPAETPAETPGTPAPSGPAPTTVEVPALVGGLQRLDGTPIPGAPVALQARSVSRHGEKVQERTVAEAVTDAQGRFSLPAPPADARHGTWLRALYSGAGGSGAAVSAPLLLTPGVAVSPPAAPLPSSPAGAPPAP